MVLGTRYWAGPPEKLNGKSHTAVVLGASRPAGPIRCPGVGSSRRRRGMLRRPAGFGDPPGKHNLSQSGQKHHATCLPSRLGSSLRRLAPSPAGRDDGSA